MFSFVIIDDETFIYVIGAVTTMVLVAIIRRPLVESTTTTGGKVMGAIAIAIIVAFVLFVWLYARAR